MEVVSYDALVFVVTSGLCHRSPSTDARIRFRDRHLSRSRIRCPRLALNTLHTGRAEVRLCNARSLPEDADAEQASFVEGIVIPQEWTLPEAAAQESEWLRVALHKWLDNEFCPEPANNEISERCSKVYYYCLMEKQLDIGDILMQMVRDLETFSFKESFHGAFTSANAAIDIIIKKIQTLKETKD